MPPLPKVISISPSNVPAVSSVPVGKLVVTWPWAALVIVQLKVLLTVVLPSSRNRNLTEPPVTFMGAHVALLFGSSVIPEAAVWLFFNVKVSSGKVSPVTKFRVSEYAISSTYRLINYISPDIIYPAFNSTKVRELFLLYQRE
jgi:hypothetical protein